MEQTDCISVSGANELQTERGWERGEKTQFPVFEICCIIPLEYHLSPYSSSVASWQVMLNINLCPWGKTSAAFKTLTNWFSTNSLPCWCSPTKHNCWFWTRFYTWQPLLEENPEQTRLSLSIFVCLSLNPPLLPSSFVNLSHRTAKTNGKKQQKDKGDCITLYAAGENKSICKMSVKPASLHRAKGK